eukprot:767394-Hanusia_phi.AAC.4
MSDNLNGTKCPERHYCPGGSSLPQDCNSEPGRFCPAGSYRPLGRTCPAGYYCQVKARGRRVQRSRFRAGRGKEGMHCSPGKVLPRGQEALLSSLELVTRVGAAATGADKADCEAPAGSFCPQGAAAADATELCPAGHYCASIGWRWIEVTKRQALASSSSPSPARPELDTSVTWDRPRFLELSAVNSPYMWCAQETGVICPVGSWCA